MGLSASELVRDAGPSAGYFGSLGLVSSRFKSPWQWISGITMPGFLAASLGKDAWVK